MKNSVILNLIVLFLTTYTIGCSDDDTTESSSSSSTPVVETEGTSATDENDLEVPLEPFAPKRMTTIAMDITIPDNYDASLAYFGQRSAGEFDPSLDASFRVTDIKVIDADGNEKVLTIDFVIGQQASSISPRVLGYFLSLDGIALNILKKNDAHTAFYLKSGRCDNIDYENTFILNQSTLTTNGMPASLNKWYGGCIKYVNGETKRNPATTDSPSYVAEQGGGATRDTSLPNYSQPLATVGYPQYEDFLTKDFTTLAGFTSLTEPEKATAALAETRTLLITERNNNGPDIGWYGMPANERSNLTRRFHIIELNLTLIKNDSAKNGTTIQINQNTFKVANFNIEDQATTTPEIVQTNVDTDITLNYTNH